MTLTRKMRISTTLIIMCIIIFPLSRTFSADKRIFTDDDVDSYQYGNGNMESAVIENTDRTPQRTKTIPEINLKEESFKQRLNTINANMHASK